MAHEAVVICCALAEQHPGAFKRDDKRENKGRHRKTLDDELLAAVRKLAADKPLPRRYRDHRLAGEWKDHRDCHTGEPINGLA